MKNSTTTKLMAGIGVGYTLLVLGAVRTLALAYSVKSASSKADGDGSASITKSRIANSQSATRAAVLDSVSQSTPRSNGRHYHGLAHGKDGSCVIYITADDGSLIDILAAEDPDDFTSEWSRMVAKFSRPEIEDEA